MELGSNTAGRGGDSSSPREPRCDQGEFKERREGGDTISTRKREAEEGQGEDISSPSEPRCVQGEVEQRQAGGDAIDGQCEVQHLIGWTQSRGVPVLQKKIIEKDDLQQQMLNHRSTCRKRLETQPLKNEKSFPSNKMSNDYESLPREAIQKLGAIENESVNVECDWTKGDASYKYKDVMRQFVAEVDCASVPELIDKIRVCCGEKIHRV